MTGQSLITEAMRAAIGVESEPSLYEVDKEAIRRWAEAIGDPNPLYHDEVYAQKIGYRSLLAPPAFFPCYDYPLIRGKSRVEVKSPLGRNLNGGDSIEVFQPIQAGDKVNITRKLVEIVEKEGRLGPMILFISEATIRNVRGEILSIARHTEITY